MTDSPSLRALDTMLANGDRDAAANVLRGVADDFPDHVAEQVRARATLIDTLPPGLSEAAQRVDDRHQIEAEKGRRAVPIAGLLRERLIEHRLRSGGAGLAFGREDGTTPFAPNTISQRGKRTWERAGLDPITLHEARHTAASYLIAAGVNLKAVSVFMGHANISITLDRYGHLLPGSVNEGAELLDAYLVGQLQRAEDAARRGELATRSEADSVRGHLTRTP